MSKHILSPEEQARREELKAARKAEAEQIKKFKHRMEIIRTVCAVSALLLNIIILLHIFRIF